MSDAESEDEREQMDGEPTVSSGEDGIDLSLISWMLELTPEERLRAAQDMIDTVWALRYAEKSS